MIMYVKISDEEKLPRVSEGRAKSDYERYRETPIKVKLGEPAVLDADKKPPVEGKAFTPTYYAYSDSRLTHDDFDELEKKAIIERPQKQIEEAGDAKAVGGVGGK